MANGIPIDIGTIGLLSFVGEFTKQKTGWQNSV
jgi:hypothetical protein